MSKHIIDATIREEKGRKTDSIRVEGIVPAVVYGVATEPVAIAFDRNAFIKTYKEAGESSLITLNIEGKEPLHVLIQDFQKDAVTDQVTHVDLRSIDVNKEIETDVSLEFIGEAPAIKSLGGTMVPSRTSVTIRCLPTNLVRNISVDLSVLETFEDSITVGDLAVPEGVIILENPEQSIVSISPPRTSDEPVTAGEEDIEEVPAEEGTEGEKTPAQEEKKA